VGVRWISKALVVAWLLAGCAASSAGSESASGSGSGSVSESGSGSESESITGSITGSGWRLLPQGAVLVAHGDVREVRTLGPLWAALSRVVGEALADVVVDRGVRVHGAVVGPLPTTRRALVLESVAGGLQLPADASRETRLGLPGRRMGELWVAALSPTRHVACVGPCPAGWRPQAARASEAPESDDLRRPDPKATVEVRTRVPDDEATRELLLDWVGGPFNRALSSRLTLRTDEDTATLDFEADFGDRDMAGTASISLMMWMGAAESLMQKLAPAGLPTDFQLPALRREGRHLRGSLTLPTAAVRSLADAALTALASDPGGT
jgi:hypothetical protein